MQAKTLPEILPLTENRATSTLVWTVGFAILTAAGAQLALPTIPVPMTLQTPFVLLAGALLGARIGAWSQLTYLAAGTMLPVFANGAGGLPYLAATPTIGYLLGFPVAALVTGALVGRGGYLRTVLAMTLGMTALFTCGMLGLVSKGFTWRVAFEAGFLDLQLFDVVKIASTAFLASLVLRTR
ncbi:MAG: biotin transporter BioY [Planctomycetes bacterium]|nr:biotin transporter BioY [Planctomycetota bacterium]